MSELNACHRVILHKFEPVTLKCYKAVDFQKNEELIPSSQFLGYDLEYSGKGIAVFLTAWILGKKKLIYEKDTFYRERNVPEEKEIIVKHRPEKLVPEKGVKADETLIR